MNRRLISAVAIGVIAALTLAACGSSTQSSESVSTEQGQSSESAGESNTEATSKAKARGARALAGVRASILRYGKAATNVEAAAAGQALAAFFSDRGDRLWAAACSYLSAEMRFRLKQVGGPGSAGCGRGIEAMTASATTAEGETRIARVKELRRDGKQGFLIYTTKAGKTNAMLMVREGGKWKLAGVNPTPIG